MTTTKTPAHIAVGVVKNKDDKYLVAFRPEEKIQGGLWEFPGGKLDPNESVKDALARELFEETGIKILKAHALTECDYRYGDHHHVYLHVWLVDAFAGEAHGKEGQPVKWVTLEELKTLSMLSANELIIEAIQNIKLCH